MKCPLGISNFLEVISAAAAAKLLQSCLTPCNPIDGNPLGSPVPGILQVRTLKRSLFSPILLFSSISLHWSLRKAFLSLLAILWNSAFRWIYLSFSPLPFTSLLFSAICKASSDNRLPFLVSFSWGWSWSLLPVRCHKPPSVVLQALGLSDLIPWISSPPWGLIPS